MFRAQFSLRMLVVMVALAGINLAALGVRLANPPQPPRRVKIGLPHTAIEWHEDGREYYVPFPPPGSKLTFKPVLIRPATSWPTARRWGPLVASSSLTAVVALAWGITIAVKARKGRRDRAGSRTGGDSRGEPTG